MQVATQLEGRRAGGGAAASLRSLGLRGCSGRTGAEGGLSHAEFAPADLPLNVETSPRQLPPHTHIPPPTHTHRSPHRDPPFSSLAANIWKTAAAKCHGCASHWPMRFVMYLMGGEDVV